VIVEKLEDDLRMLDVTAFSDEEWFHLTGYVNSQTSPIWSTENPLAAIEFFFRALEIAVWCAVSRRSINAANESL
jgi:hypothetical protein